MRLIKKLLITVLVLALLVAGAATAAYILLNDDETAGFVYDETPMVIENELASDISDSLKRIKDSNYETNELQIDMTMGQLNSFVVSTIQTSLNTQYLVEGGMTSVYEKDGFRVDSVYFASEGSDIQLYACIGYKEIIKSAARISAGIKIEEGNKLVISLSAIKVGKYINLNSGSIKSLLDNFKQYLSGANIDGLDLENLTYTIDLNKVIHDALESNKFIRDMFCALDFSAKIDDGKIKLMVDTTKIFTGPRTKPTSEEYTFDSTKIATELATNGYSTIEINEAQFNGFAYDNLNTTIGAFATSFELGEKSFALSCSDPWYNISKGQVETCFSVNEVESTAAFIADIKPEKDDSGVVTTLLIHAELASVGNLSFGEMESADGFVFDFNVDPSSLLPEEYKSTAKVTDFSQIKDEANPKISFTISL